MKTLMQNKTVTKAVTIALFLAVFFVPTLTVIADESGDVSDAGGDSFYSAYDNDMWPTVGEVFDVGGDTAVEVPVSDAGGDSFYSAYDNDMWPTVGEVFDAGGDTAIEVPVSDAGGDTRYEEVTEIAYVYEETTYPYYYGGYSGFSAGYSVEYPTYRDTQYNTYTNYETRNPSPTCTLSSNRSSIDEGDDVRLSWTTSNATSISINNGVGTVSGSGSVTVSPSSSRTYVLVANGAGGSVWCSETVTVDEDNGSNNGNARCDSFTASDTRVEEGDEVTLRWRTTNADDVRINQGVGDVDDDGSERVTIDEDTTFTLTARDGSDTDTCRVTVRVDGNGTDNGTAPRCTFHVSDTSIARGGSTILSWNNDRTERLTLKDSSGTTIADSDDDRDIDEDRDALTVRPNKSTTYTLSVYNGNTRRTCTLDVNVGGQVAGGISLSQVPYTGFSAGPVLTAIFYGAIVVWGLILAYVLVIRKRDEAVVAEEQDWSLEDVDSVEVDSIEENTVPENLPIMAEEVVSDEEAFQSLEAYAHEHSALISSDALRFIAGQGDSDTERTEILSRVINLAKAKYPKEGDWVIINKERVLAVLA